MSEDDLEKRFEALESRLAFQEHELHQLNQALYDSQRRIDQLEGQNRELVKRYKEVSEKLPDHQKDEPPPHY